MDFPSFLPNRKNSGRKTPTTSQTSDPDATAVQPGWASMLQQHLNAQQPPKHVALDGVRHTAEPSMPPQRQSRQNSTNPQNCVYCRDSGGKACRLHTETQIFQKPNFENTEEYNAYMRANSPKQTTPPPPFNPTDVTQVMQQVQTFKPMEELRSVRYFGANRAILVVVGYQVHFANVAGVVITENGPGVTTATFIPWHRVVELNARLDDPILKVRS